MKHSAKKVSSGEMPLEEFAERLCALMPAFMRRVAAESRNYFARGLITLPQLRILSLLEERGRCSMRDLAGGLSLRCPTITAMMDRLSASGLARRERSVQDRRIVLAAITPKGRRVMAKFREDRKRAVMKAFSGLSSTDRRAYLDIIQRLAGAIKAEDGQDR